MKTKFVLNGKKVSVEISPMTRLLDVVRNEFGLTGSKEGCGEGECGACSVLINGKVVNSCLIPVCQVEGDKVQTIEGFAKNRKLSILQKAFVEKGGAQCGICTPGMIVAAESFLKIKKKFTDLDLREALAGNLCRCTGYTKIFDAVKSAARRSI